MSLNIKNEETHRLVRRLADRLGESQSEAVRIAVVEKLERVEKGGEKAMVERLINIGREFREQLGERVLPDINELYDENGLPK